MQQYSLAQLQALPTISEAQASDLKVEDHESGLRHWLSRCSVADGEPYDNKVTVEKFENGRWRLLSTYQAR